MGILLFTDQYFEDDNSLLELQRSKSEFLLVSAFLDKAHAALREELCLLSKAAQAQIPSSNSVVDLYERLRRHKVRSLELESALVCINQLAAFIRIVEGSPEGYLSTREVVVGYGLGQLSAAAVSCSHNVLDLVDAAAEVVRLAFRVGAVVRKLSVGLQSSDASDLPWTAVVEDTYDPFFERLESIQDDLDIPLSARLYPTFVTTHSVKLSGHPSRISQVATTSQLLTNVEHPESTLFGLWHARHIYGQDAISEALGPRLDSLSKIKVPHMQLLSPSTGKVSVFESGKSLLERTITDILTEPVRWDKLQDALSGFLDLPVLGFGDRFSITSLATSLRKSAGKQVKMIDPAPQMKQASGGSNAEKIAVVGMSARLPGASDVEELWELLANGRDLHKEVPKDRFPVETHFDPNGKKQNTSHTPYGCFIDQPGLFDARFFHMSPREAAQTDPMHRLALVTAYEALEMSGFVLNSTPSTRSDRIGTFYGQTSDDWREVNAAQDIGTYFIPGGVRAFAPGRISYHFGFSGPSYSVDTACSSSMAAIQMACTSLRSGECDTVVAGGLNILTAPDIFAGLSRGQFLSKTGPCQTWDINADGYCRADGVGSVVLKRYDDAIKEKDNILGVILATATNHSADAISITHPHAGNQAQLFESVLNNSGTNPMDISYIEMHGTGTQAGDLAETQSVTDVFAPVGARNAQQTLHIGAIKSSIGHSEAAAGVSALIKVLLMLQKNSIPPHVGIKNQLNPALPDFANRNVNIAFEVHPWSPRPGKPRLAFLNNFSAAGGNTAMLLQEHMKVPSTGEPDARASLPFTVSARSLASLRRNVHRLVDFLEQTPGISLGSLSYTLTARRMPHSYRIGLAAADIKSLRSGLLANADVTALAPVPSKLPKVAFAYTGQGAFYANLGRDLLEQSSVFSNALKHYDHLATSMGFPSFLPAIESSTAPDKDLSPLVVQVATACVQMALTRLWESWGVQPAFVIAHSLGEYAALNAAGVLSDADTIYLVAHRVELLEKKCAAGTHAMLAVKASVAEIESAVHTHGFSYDIACINSAKDTVLSGQLEVIKDISTILEQASYRCIMLNLPYAFHSAQLDPMLDEFERLAHGAVFNKPTIPVLSPLLAQVVEDNIFTPDYLRQHARETVDFAGAIQQAVDDGLTDAKTIFVEVGPHPLCSRMIKSHFGSDVSALPSLQKDRSPWEVLSSTAVTLHCAGIDLDWHEFHRDFDSYHELLQLPAYSFEEKNYWIDYVNDWCLHKVEPRGVVHELPAPVAAIPPKRLSSSVHRLVSEEIRDDTIIVLAHADLSDPELRPAFEGHQVNDTALCSSSIYADQAFTLGDFVLKKMRPGIDFGMNVGQIEVKKPLTLKGDGSSQTLQVSITADFGRNTATLQYSIVDATGKELALHAEGTVFFEDKAAWANEWSSSSYLIHGRIDALKDKVAHGKADQVTRRMAYKLFASLVSYDIKFQGMEEVVFDSANFEATARIAFQTQNSDGSFFANPYWLDSVGHVSGFILNGGDATDSKNYVYISHGWSSLRLLRPLQRNASYTNHVKMRATPNNVMTGDVYILEGEEIVGVWGGVRFQRIPRKILNSFLPPGGGAVSAAPKVIPTPKAISASSKTTPAVSKTQSGVDLKASSVQFKTHRPRPRRTPAVSASPTPASGLVEAAMEIIAGESDTPRAELQDLCEWENLGVDSLLSLQITGKLREDLDIELPSSSFLNNPTVGDFKKYLSDLTAGRSSSTTSFPTPEDSEPSDSDSHSDTTVETSPDEVAAANKPQIPSGNADDIISKIRNTISEQMGIPVEEITDKADLASLGADSLMSICILGALRENADLTLPSTLFQDCPTIEAIGEFLNPKASPPTQARRAQTPLSRSPTRKTQSPSRQYRATSILLQGTRHATTKVFLFPDGSGSATSYAHLPTLSSSVAVYGLNSPFMTSPSAFTLDIGIPGIASLYLAEVRRRQPQGPYHLGGWSAGGIVAYEVMQQLFAAGETVPSLILFDSPCPIDLEALPPRLHEFFAEIGLLGDGGNKEKIPNWLVPHFGASIAALSAYKPQPIPKANAAPKTLAIWAKHGVCRYPGQDPRPERTPDEPKSMTWLLDNRTDFGTNGWERLFGGDGEVVAKSVDGNHFNMMRDGAQLNELAGFVREFLKSA